MENNKISASICNIENYKPSQKPQRNHGLRPKVSAATLRQLQSQPAIKNSSLSCLVSELF